MTYHTEWTPELAEALSAPFAPGDHKTKKQGGSSITFVDVHRYKGRLNSLVGPHGWAAANRFDVVGGKLISTVALTVLGVTKENVGDEVEVPEVNERGNEKIIGSPATNSYSQAFKRAAADFGLGAYLYDETKKEAAKRGTNGAAKMTEAQAIAIEDLLESRDLSDDEKDKARAWMSGAPSHDDAKRFIQKLSKRQRAAEGAGA